MGEYSKSAIIKYTRKALGMTQEELSESICDPVSLARYESGKTNPTDEKFLRLMEKMGEKGSIFFLPLETDQIEIEKNIEELKKAVECYKWEEAEQIYIGLKSNKKFNLEYPENKQYLKWAETLIKNRTGKLDLRQSILELEKAWAYTCGHFSTKEFPLNRIYRETEIRILHDLAVFYKISGQYKEACDYYERLLKYFERKDMINDCKPVYFIYLGYSNVLGLMGEHEKSRELCFKAIKRGLMQDQTNYLYNFYYNIGYSFQKYGNEEEKKMAKLYIWIAYQLCLNYPENNRNLQIIKNTYEQC